MEQKRQQLGTGGALALAWSFGWPIAAGVLAGSWLDRWLGTAPWLTLGLAIGAMVMAVGHIIRALAPEGAAGDADTGEPGGGREPS